jgi:TPR repeat protein
MANQALLYLNGSGVEKDLQKAAALMEKAAAGGGAIAQYNVGRFYRTGQGVVQNDKTAIYWFKLSADQGFADAQADLAIALAEGHGIEVNLIESLRLIYLAEQAGSERATEIKKIIEARMTKKDISTAKKMVSKNDQS